SDTRVPLIAAVLPVTALAIADLVEAGHCLNPRQVLGVLVAEVALDAQPQRSSVADRERLTVKLMGDERLRVERVVEVTAFVVRHAAKIVGAAEDDEAGLFLEAGRVEDRRELRTGPLTDRTPAFDAVMAGDLRTLGKGADLVHRQAERAIDQPAHLEPPLGEIGGLVSAVEVGFDVGVAVAPEIRRDVGRRILAGHSRTSPEQTVRAAVEPFGAVDQR